MDLISRQAAIDAIVDCTNCKTVDELRAYVTKHTLDNGWTGGIVDALDAVEALPSAQPEKRKKGKWIHGKELCGEMMGNVVTKISYDGWKCSVCDCLVEDESKPLWNFCPNCGADMRGEGNDET